MRRPVVVYEKVLQPGAPLGHGHLRVLPQATKISHPCWSNTEIVAAAFSYLPIGTVWECHCGKSWQRISYYDGLGIRKDMTGYKEWQSISGTGIWGVINND